MLGQLHLGRHALIGRGHAKVLWPQAQSFDAFWRGSGQQVPQPAVRAGCVGRRAINEVDARRANEPRDKLVRRLVVKLQRGAELFHHTLVEHSDAVTHGHGLNLVMGHVNHGRAQLLVQPGQLDAHVHAQRGVKVRQRLVKQKNLGLAHDGAPDGHPLALPT